MEYVREIVTIRAEVSGLCDYCDAGDWGKDGDWWLENQVNHLLKEHGFKLLHIGQETTLGHDGNPWQSTVAVLGSSNPPEKIERPSVEDLFLETGEGEPSEPA